MQATVFATAKGKSWVIRFVQPGETLPQNADPRPPLRLKPSFFKQMIGNRPFVQLLSGLETGHPAAAGPSPACEFSVSDEQKAVFLVSVLDCSECDSSGLDHLNSSWSIARLIVLKKKNRSQLNGKKAEFLQW